MKYRLVSNPDEQKKIADLNDSFRAGRVVMTQRVALLSDKTRNLVLDAVRDFKQFTPDNDPYQEHDFGKVEVDGEKYFWKIDYYDMKLEYGSEDPSNASLTIRSLTIMRADEY